MTYGADYDHQLRYTIWPLESISETSNYDRSTFVNYFVRIPIGTYKLHRLKRNFTIPQSKPAGRTAPLNLSSGGGNGGEPWVVHSGVVIVLAKLLPALPRPPEHEPYARAIRDYLAHVLKSLVRR